MITLGSTSIKEIYLGDTLIKEMYLGDSLLYTSDPEAIDLSLFDVYGNPINRSTANCYVIKKPGKYKFPLVYGNAIKNGLVNTAAFTNNGGEYSHDFVNGLSEVIEQPLLSLDVDDIGYLSVTNSDVTESDIISYETADDGAWIIKEENEFLWAEFTITQIPSTGANILVGADNMTGSLMWVWHIWLWPYDLTPVEITNSTGYKYNIMPYNLATKYDDDLIHIKNWFYQWGRPNPLLLPSAYNSTTDHSPGSIEKTSKASSLHYGILHPTMFYCNTDSPCNWFGDQSYYNLWDAACTGTGNSDNDIVKTVYDPCPVGWKIPNGNAFTGFSTSNVVGSFANGWKFKRYSGDTVGIFFPASGYRYFANGLLHNVGSYSCVWLSSADSQDDAYGMYFNSSDVDLQYYNCRSFGYSVRPVQDDIYDIDNIDICFKINDVTYKARNGMTWDDWINSTFYNTGGYSLTPSSVVSATGLVSGILSPTANATDVITPGSSYTHTATSGDGGSSDSTSSNISVDLNSQWQASSITNPDSSLYDIYESYSNYNVNSGVATMYITITGLTEFTCYIRSYAESNYDYVSISQLDQTITGSSSSEYKDTTLVKAYTRGNQQSGTALSNYTEVSYTDIDGGTHVITVIYRKDSSDNSGDDKGYILVPKSSGSSISVTWATQSGSWTEGTNSSAYDGKQFTSVSPGSSGSTVTRCTFSGATSVTFNCVYNGESNYDYLTVGALDTACTRSSYGTTLKGTSGTAQDISFTCDTGEHYVEFCYSKDGSVDTSPDCAVVYLKSIS